MATKYLARTAIEGGRRNTWERRQTNVEERADTRVYLERLKTEDADGLPGPMRRPEHKEFSDKLNPALRFLQSRAGRVWNDVHSELRKKFDSRTTAGRHILFDHILRSYVSEDEYRYGGRSSYGFSVDDNGILRYTPPKRMWRTERPKIGYPVTYRSEAGVRTWLKSRYIEEYDGKLWWTNPLDKRLEKCEIRDCPKAHPYERFVERPVAEIASGRGRAYQKLRDWDGFELPMKRVHEQFHEVITACKRVEKLNERDLAYWKTLHPTYKERILEKKI